MGEDRVGSIVFYLDPRLRAKVRATQLHEFPFCEPFTAEPHSIVAIPERRLDYATRYCNLNGLRFQAAGHYRLYTAGQLQRRFFTACAPSETRFR